MPAESHRVPERQTPPTYFVGRRPYEAAELYAVSANDVQRLRPKLADPTVAVDWHRGDAVRMEISRAVLSRVIARRPSRALVRCFALDVLPQLPDGGFVLDSDEVWQWLRRTADPQDLARRAPRLLSWARWLRNIFRRSGATADWATDA